MTRFALGLALALLAAPAARAQPEGFPLPPPLERGRVGIQVQPMTPELRQHMGAPKDTGVLVVRVADGSPGAAAGVKVGDVITSAGGENVEGPHVLIQRVAKVPEGERLALGIVRDGKPLALEVAPEGKPLPGPDAWEQWFGGGMRRGAHDLERRVDELERRMEELESRLPKPS